VPEPAVWPLFPLLTLLAHSDKTDVLSSALLNAMPYSEASGMSKIPTLKYLPEILAEYSISPYNRLS